MNFSYFYLFQIKSLKWTSNIDILFWKIVCKIFVKIKPSFTNFHEKQTSVSIAFISI